MPEIPMAENGIQKQGSRKWKRWVCGFGERVKEWPRLAWRTMWKVGKDDPRRAIHSLKVGAALTLVSFLYLLEPLFKGIGQNAMWAVMTVVVVMEFTAGMANSISIVSNFVASNILLLCINLEALCNSWRS